jgi:membrane protein
MAVLTSPRRLWLLGTKAFAGFNDDNCTQMAAAIAYYVLFAAVPLAMVAFSIFGIVLQDEETLETATERIEEAFNVGSSEVTIDLAPEAAARIEGERGAEAVREVEEALVELNTTDELEDERAALAEEIERGEEVTIAGVALAGEDLQVSSGNIVSEALNDVVIASTSLGLIGLLAFAYSGTVMFMAIRRALDIIWGAPVKRPFFQQKLMDFAMLFGLIFLLAVTVAITVTLRTLGNESLDALPFMPSDDGLLWDAVSFGVPWAMAVVLFLLLYRYVPNAPTHFRDVWPGAVLAATLFEGLQFGYSIYVANFSTYDVVYGALGAVLLFMFFVFLASCFVLYGAEVAVEYPKVARGAYDDEAGSQESISLQERGKRAIVGLFVPVGEKERAPSAPVDDKVGDGKEGTKQ